MYSNLIADNRVQTIEIRKETVQGIYKRGDLVEYDSATKLIKHCTSADKIYGIVAEDIDSTTTLGIEALVYLAGYFNITSINKDQSITDEQLEVEARKLSIYLK